MIFRRPPQPPAPPRPPCAFSPPPVVVAQLWDKDKSGILDPSELVDLKVAMKLSDEVWADLLDRVDLDKDGRIDAKEFVLLCQALNKRDNLPPKKIRKPKAADASASSADASSAGGPSPVVLGILGLVAVAAIGYVAFQNGALDSFLGKTKKTK